MKQITNNYPVTGVQHSLAVAALTVLTICLEQYADTSQSQLAKHIELIKREVDACGMTTKKKKLSAGSRRALDACSLKLAPYIALSPDINKNELFTRWAALVWCAMTFIDDVNVICPQFTYGTFRRKWRKLQEYVAALAFALLMLEPGVDEKGTQIYLKAAYALDGIDFISFDELEKTA